jgi:hypothetical protein
MFIYRDWNEYIHCFKLLVFNEWSVVNSSQLPPMACFLPSWHQNISERRIGVWDGISKSNYMSDLQGFSICVWLSKYVPFTLSSNALKLLVKNQDQGKRNNPIHPSRSLRVCKWTHVFDWCQWLGEDQRRHTINLDMFTRHWTMSLQLINYSTLNSEHKWEFWHVYIHWTCISGNHNKLTESPIFNPTSSFVDASSYIC